MILPNYDKTYFEDGVKSKVSGYENYRWRPEYVLPLANWISQSHLYFNEKVLDYGCAKGFLVKALKLLNIDAYGYDISSYAINNCEPEVKDFVTDVYEFQSNTFDIVVAKDVLEHIEKKEIPLTLQELNRISKNKLIAIIPLGDNGKFRIPEYEKDVTHVTKEDEVWWIKQFNDANFKCTEFYYSLPGIKENWTSKYPYGNGIFVLEKR